LAVVHLADDHCGFTERLERPNQFARDMTAKAQGVCRSSNKLSGHIIDASAIVSPVSADEPDCPS